MSSRQIQIVVGLLIVIAIGVGLVMVADKNRKIIAAKLEAEKAASLAATEKQQSQETQGGSGAVAVIDAVVPSFDVARIEPSGDGVIAGLAAPGALVELLANGVPIGSTTASDVGEWVIVLEKPLASGSHDLALRSTPPEGKPVASEEFIAVVIPDSPAGEVLVVASRPGRASEILARPESTEQMAAVSDGVAAPAEETAGQTAKPDAATAAVETKEPDTASEETQIAAADQTTSPDEASDTAMPQQTLSASEDIQVAAVETPDQSETDPQQPVEQAASDDAVQPEEGDKVSESGETSTTAADVAVEPGTLAESDEPARIASSGEPAAADGSETPGTDGTVVADSGQKPDPGADAGQEIAAIDQPAEVDASGVVEKPQIDDSRMAAPSDAPQPSAPEPATEIASGEPSPPGDTGTGVDEPDQAVAAAAEAVPADDRPATVPESAGQAVQPPATTADDAANENQVPVEKAPKQRDIQVATAEPVAQPEAAKPKVDVQLALDAVETEGDMVYAAGTGNPGARVRVYVDNTFIGEAVANDDGRWLLETPAEIAAGNVIVRADELAGETYDVARRAEVPFMKQVDSIALLPATAEAGGGASQTVSGAAVTGPKSVIIRSGDNLWTISRRVYGRGIRYTTIYQANDDQIRNPHMIFPGQVFVLPAGERSWTQ